MLTDNEIKKALECCGTGDFCNHCKYQDYRVCRRHLAKDALDLIIRQEAEVERLKSRDMQVEVSKKLEKEIKAEAVKEFAEKCKVCFPQIACAFDCFAKGMVGDGK